MLAAYIVLYTVSDIANRPSRPFTSRINDKVYLTRSHEQLTEAALGAARASGLVRRIVEQQFTEVSLVEWENTFDSAEALEDPGRPVFIFALRGEIDWSKTLSFGPFMIPENPASPRPTLTPTPPDFYDAMTIVLDSQTGHFMSFHGQQFIASPLLSPRPEQILAMGEWLVQSKGTPLPTGYWETITAPEFQETVRALDLMLYTASPPEVSLDSELNQP